jgi:demethylmenaquinone methyltransferase / 2-methoxy-6-polyprenyl-1,4-benzoquinol methylase
MPVESETLLNKQEPRIRRMFGEIAPWYDFLNHFLSLNIDKTWRTKTVRRVPVGDGPLLDLCTGTGDLAFAYRRSASADVKIIGSDSCRPMLELAKKKAAERQVAVDFFEADSQELPFADDTFAVTTVSFGLRNITDPHKGLSEMVRVTKPGGRVAVLEFSKPKNRFLRGTYNTYFKHVLPRIGQALSKSQDNAYSYLPASVQQFPDGAALVAWLEQAGLTEVTFEVLTFGVATLYVGQKPLPV